MEIMKIFSSYDDYGYEDERLYSVLMDEEELALFSELQKEYSASKLGNFIRKQKRNLKVAGEELSLAKNMAMGSDLTAKQTHALHRNQRLARLKNRNVYGVDPIDGGRIKGKARDLISEKNIDALRRAERIGKGTKNTIFGLLPKN